MLALTYLSQSICHKVGNTGGRSEMLERLA